MSSEETADSKAVSFNIDGPIASLFNQVHEAAKGHHEFWSFGHLTRTDLARHLLTKQLVELARQLGVLDDD